MKTKEKVTDQTISLSISLKTAIRLDDILSDYLIQYKRGKKPENKVVKAFLKELRKYTNIEM